MGGPGLNGFIRVGDGAPGVVVAVELNVHPGPHHPPHLPHQGVDLPGRGHAHGVRQAHPVHVGGDGLVDGEEVLLLGAEGVLGGEAHLHVGGRLADVGDHLLGLLNDPGDVPPMGGPEVLARAEEEVNPLDSRLHRHLGRVQAALDVGHHLGLEAQGGEDLGVLAGLGGGHRGGDLNVLNAELVQGLGDLHLVLGGEVRPFKLFPFP